MYDKWQSRGADARVARICGRQVADCGWKRGIEQKGESVAYLCGKIKQTMPEELSQDFLP